MLGCSLKVPLGGRTDTDRQHWEMAVFEDVMMTLRKKVQGPSAVLFFSSSDAFYGSVWSYLL